MDGSFGFLPDGFERGAALFRSEALVGPDSGSLFLGRLPHRVGLLRLWHAKASLFGDTIYLFLGAVLGHLVVGATLRAERLIDLLLQLLLGRYGCFAFRSTFSGG